MYSKSEIFQGLPHLSFKVSQALLQYLFELIISLTT